MHQRPSVPILILISLIVTAALAFRCTSLGASGFAEDEIDILRAIDSYRHFDFSANAEHPMLAKLAALGSMEAARRWNQLAPWLHLAGIAPEAALRFPMAWAGALTTLALFLLVERLFEIEVALWAGLLWALDVNATGINRMAKEDTLLVFFLLTAAWLFERGKQESRRDRSCAQRWYTASGAAFGLMAASKYMPHYLGLHGVLNVISRPERGESSPRYRRFFLALGAAFLGANFGLLVPDSWRHLIQYLHGRTVIHTGYLFAHRLYVNTIDTTPWGVPPTFYLVFLATKVPILVLGAFAVGVAQMVSRGHERGFAFTRIFLVFFLLPYSLIASKFVRYMLPLFALVDILAATGIVWLLRRLARLTPEGRLRALAIGAVTLMYVAGPLYAQVSTYPFPSLYRNAIGSRIAPPGYFFPDDEFNDAGVREAVEAIARVARPGAIIASDASGVVAAYLLRAGRSDLQAWSLSRDGLPMRPVETWMIVQDAHVYFENQAVIEQVGRRLRPWSELWIRGALAVQVFRIY
jgi:hypothetical protein